MLKIKYINMNTILKTSMIYIGSFIFCVSSCQSQIKNSLKIKNKKMEYFNINNYKDLPADSMYESSDTDLYYLLGNDKKIRIFFYKETIQVEESSTTSPYKTIKVYSNKNKILLAQGKEFYNIPLDIEKEYDENGKLIKEIDHEKPYKFSIEDLVKKMNDEYKVDLMNPLPGISANRYVDKSVSIYEVLVPQNSPYIIKVYKFNGTTGDLLLIKLSNGMDRKVEIIFEKKDDGKNSSSINNRNSFPYEEKWKPKNFWEKIFGT